MKTMLRILATAASIAMLPALAPAQETIKLTIASSHPLTIPWVGMMKSHFMPEVDKRLAASGKYKIAWQEAFGGQLYRANATLTSVEQGVTDIGWVFSYLESAKMPLSQVTAYTPFSTSNVPAQLETMMNLFDTFPAFKKEWEQYNLVFLGATGSDTYDLYTKKPINSLEDLRGLKLSAPGPLGTWLRGVGANAVDGALTTFYTDIQTGVSDGALSLALGVLPTKIYEVAPYVTKVDAGTVFSGGVAINRDTWNRLPQEVRDVLLAAGRSYSEAHAKDVVVRQEAAMGQIIALGARQSTPVRLSPLPSGERAKWVTNLPNLAQEWANAAAGRGLPAKEFLAAYMAGLRQRGEKPARDWDR